MDHCQAFRGRKSSDNAFLFRRSLTVNPIVDYCLLLSLVGSILGPVMTFVPVLPLNHSWLTSTGHKFQTYGSFSSISYLYPLIPVRRFNGGRWNNNKYQDTVCRLMRCDTFSSLFRSWVNITSRTSRDLL